MCVFLDTHDTGKAQSTLVKSLNEVRENHHDYNPLIDEALQASILLGGDMDGDVAGILGNFFVDTIEVHVILSDIIVVTLEVCRRGDFLLLLAVVHLLGRGSNLLIGHVSWKLQ
jgi:hypothetical protein